MNDIKANDFFATLVKNPDITIQDLRDNNITPENSSLLSMDTYKSMPQVQAAFKDSEGKFDEKKFINSYNNTKALYANYAQESLLGNVMENFTYSSDAWFAPADAIRRDDSPIILVNQKPADLSQGISYITESSLGPATKELSIREQAQKEKVVDYKTGEEFDYSPNDKAGLFNAFKMPTLVLATYDEDGYHTEDGVEVMHKAGDLKLNKNSKPYYETLGDREIYDKDVLRNSDILTVDGSKWNKFDFLDSDDIKKPGYKIALDLVAKIAPMFVPGVGEVYGYFSAADGLMRVLPVVGKAVNGILGGNENIGKALSKWEGYAAKWDPTQSDIAREKIISWEGASSMVTSVSKQLFQQRAISTIPVIFAKMRGIKDYEQIANTSKGLAFAYMAATSAQDVYGDFKKAGATDQVAGLGMIASSLALYKLMNIDYFRDNILKGTFMDESETKAALEGASKMTAVRFKPFMNAGKSMSTKEAASLVDKVSNFYHNTLVKGLQESGAKGLINRGLSEGTEEVMEEVATDLIKGITEGMSALGFPIADPSKELNFGWSGKDFAQRYGTSFVGGFIGGMVFAGQGSYEKWLNNRLHNVHTLPVNDWQKLVYYVASGKRAQIDAYLNDWHDRGLLGSKELSIDGKAEMSAKGTEEFIPNTQGMSQNDAVFYSIKNTLDSIEYAINGEVPNLQALFTDDGISQLNTMGYDITQIMANPKLLTASAISALGDYSSLEDDLIGKLSKIASTKQELEKEINALAKPVSTEDEKKTQSQTIKDNEKVKNLQEQIKKLREEKDLIINGLKNKYYSSQAMFAANQWKQKPFVDISKDAYAKLVKGMGYETLSEESKKEVDTEYDKFLSKEGREKVYAAHDLYLELNKKYAPFIQKHGEELEKAFKEGTTKLPNILGISDYALALDQRNELIKEYKELEAISEETVTDEQLQRKEKVKQEINNLNIRITRMLKNPGLMSVTPNDDTNIDVFFGTENANGKLHLVDDFGLSLLTAQTSTIQPEIAGEVVKTLRSEYQKNIANNEFRFDDQELITLFRGIASSYKELGGAEKRWNLYISAATGGSGTFKNYVEFDGEGLAISDSVSNSVEYDYGSWFNNAPQFLNDLITSLDQFIKNIGVNDAIAAKSYERFLEIVKQNSKLLEQGNEQYLKDFLSYMVPQINGESLYNIMVEFGKYKEQIRKSPLFDLLAEMGTDIKDLSLLQLIDQETDALTSSVSAEEYLIQNDKIKSSIKTEKLKEVLGVAMSIIESAADGTNDTINNFKTNEKDDSIGTLATMSEKAAMVLRQHVEILSNKIGFLNGLSEINNNRSLRIHKSTALNMRPKWIKAITALNEKDLGFNPLDLWNQVTGNATLEPSEDNFSQWETACIVFEDALYEKLHDVKNLAEILTKAVDTKTLYRAGTTLIGDDKNIEISSADLVNYLATVASIPTSNFFSAWRSSIENNNAEIEEFNNSHTIKRRKFVSIYGQELAARQIAAQAINPELFDQIIDITSDSSDIEEFYKGKDNAERNIAYLKNRSRLYHTGVVLGGAGSGKTTMIKMVLNALRGGSTNFRVAFLAKEQEQADKVAVASGFPEYAYTVDEFNEKTFGIKKNPEYVFWNSADGTKRKENNDHWRFANAGKETGDTSIIGKDGARVIVIDEIETLSEPQLKRIADYAKKYNIFVIGLGDLKQPGEDIVGKNRDNKDVTLTSGIEDCAFIRTPQLTTTMRAETIAQSEISTILRKPLDNFVEEHAKNPGLSMEEADALIDKNLPKTDLPFYENPETRDLAGIMGVNSSEELLKKLSNLEKLDGTIAIITDDVNGKYSQYTKSDKVFVVDYKKRAGGEFDYVLVDVNFGDKARGHKYLLTKDLYTLTQRARRGTIIVTSKATDLFNFVSNPQSAQPIAISENQIEDYAKWRDKTFDQQPSNMDALQEVLATSSIVTGIVEEPTPVETPENSNPAPNPTPDPAEERESSTPLEVPQTPSGVVEPSNPIPGNEETPPIPENNNSKPELKPVKKQEEKKQSTPLVTKAVEKFFLEEEGKFTNIDSFKSIFKKIFPYVDSKKSYEGLDRRISIDELVANRQFVKKLRDAINIKYGKEGVDLLNDILAHSHGYNKEDGEKVLERAKQLRLVESTFEDFGKQLPYHKIAGETDDRKVLSGYEAVSDQEIWFNTINSNEFYNWTKSTGTELGSFHSIEKLDKSITKGTLQQLYRLVSDKILDGTFTNKSLYKLAQVANIEAFVNDNDFIGKDARTEMWIVPYENNRILVSRHFNAKGEFFDIPILFIQGSGISGQYKGPINQRTKTTLEKGEWVTLAALRDKYPGLVINDEMGILKVSDEDKKSGFQDLNDRAREFITGSERKSSNIGKPFTVCTTNSSLAERLFNGFRAYYTDHNTGDTITEYDKLEVAGIQCRATAEDFLKLLWLAEPQIVDANDSMNPKKNHYKRSKTNIEGESNTVADASVLDKIELLKDDKGNTRQLLPEDRSGKLLTSLILSNDNLAFWFNSFLNTNLPGSKLKHSHTIVLKVGENEYIEIGLKDGYLVAGPTGGKYFTQFTDGQYSKIKIPFTDNSKKNLEEVFNSVYGEDWRKNLPQMHFKYYSVSKENKPYERSFSSNWELAAFLITLDESERVSALETAMKEIGMENGIYMDDNAKFSETQKDSYYGMLNKGNRVYWTQYTELTYPTYQIDLDPTYIVPVKEDIKEKTIKEDFSIKSDFWNISDIDISVVDIEEHDKAWKSNPEKSNKTLRIYLKGQHNKGYFELVKDEEKDYYSVHFKTAAEGAPYNAENTDFSTKEERAILFQQLANAIPYGMKFSTWGSLSEEGRHAIDKLAKIANAKKVDERKVTLKTTKEEIKIPIYQKGPKKVSLQTFLSNSNLGITANTVTEANIELEYKAKDWRSKYIIETDLGYEIKTHGDENFEDWLKYVMTMELPYDNNIFNIFNNLKNNEVAIVPGFTTKDENGNDITSGYILTKLSGEYKFKKIENIENYGDINSLPNDYLLSRFFDLQYNQNNLIDLMKTNLEIAQKIAIFEDRLTDEFGC